MLRDEDQLVTLRGENEELQRQIDELRQQAQQQHNRQLEHQQQQPPSPQPRQQQQQRDYDFVANFADRRPAVHRVAVKLPPFWSDKPKLWFSQADSQFTLSDITNEVTKFHYVVSQLDARIALEIEDVIENPPPLNPYTFLRTKLIDRLSASEEQRVRQLISEEELGDRKPSQFLRHLRSLAGSAIVQDNLLRQLWLKRLPSNVQAILATQSELQLDNIAELADKIVEVSPSTPTFAVNAALSDKSIESNLLNTIADLQKQVAELSAFRSCPHHSRSSSNSSRRRSKSQNRSNSNQQICWYHKKFQDKAKKCISPCNYLENGKSSL